MLLIEYLNFIYKYLLINLFIYINIDYIKFIKIILIIYANYYKLNN